MTTSSAARPTRRPRPIIDSTRRQFLRGAGGFALALPLLPSLLVKNAYGADPAFTRHPRMFWLTTEHGGAFESSMFPQQSLLTNTTNLFVDHQVRSGALVPTTQSGRTVISGVLQASNTLLTPALLAKMNVFQGLDIPFYIGHHTGGHLGNYARNDGNGGDGGAVQAFPRPTIDQIMAWSPSFYPDLSSNRARAMIMGDRPVSWNYSNPGALGGPVGNIEHVSGEENSLQLFNRIFVPQSMPGGAAVPVVDRVLQSYQRLRNGNRRLSGADRQRLDDHMDRLNELQRRLNAVVSCTSVTTPTDSSSNHNNGTEADAIATGRLYNDVVAAAFICGTSKIAVHGMDWNERYISYAGDWHHNVAHEWFQAANQVYLVDTYQRIFEHLMVDLASKLDVEEVPGQTFLDNSLLVWTQESGMETHDTTSIPVVTFGSAGGAFRTGQFFDYRRVGNPVSRKEAGGQTQWLGMLYNQWLATVLCAMGVPRAEFERWGHRGYGVPFLTQDSWTPPYQEHYESTTSRYFQIASDILPMLRAT